MRSVRMLLGTALVLSVACAARGESAPFQASVQTDGAEVRCLPGMDPADYITQKLKRGDKVEVIEQRGDWLKITPPKGSYSWVNLRQVSKKDDQSAWMWVVAVPEAPIIVGSDYKAAGQMDVVGTRRPRGNQLLALGPPQKRNDDGEWLPIEPPGDESRYILARDVTPLPGSGTPATTTVAHVGSASEVAAKQGSSATSPIRVGAVVPTGTTDPLLTQAEDMERAGNRAAAAALYDQLGNRVASTNRDAATQYYNRATWLRGSSTTVPASSSAVSPDALYQQAQQFEQSGNRTEAARCYTQLGDMFRYSDARLATQYYNRAAWLRQAQPAPRVNPAPADLWPQGSAVSVQSAGVGQLLRANTWIDGRPTYVLQSAQGTVVSYLTPQPGVDLEHFVGQNLEAFGRIIPRNDVQGQYATVVKVRLLSGP